MGMFLNRGPEGFERALNSEICGQNGYDCISE